MKGVGSGLGHGAHKHAGVAAFIGAIAVGLDRELLQRVGIRERRGRIEKGIVIVTAVERVVVAPESRPIHRNGFILLLIAPAAPPNARHQQLQRHRIASVQRQLRDAFRIDHFADRTGARLDLHRLRLHFDPLVDLPDLQREIHAPVLAHLQQQAGLNRLLETGR